MALVVAAAAVLNVHASKVCSVREDVAKDAAGKAEKWKRSENRLAAAERADADEKTRFDYLASATSSRASYAKALAAIREAMLPGTWLQTFEMPEGDGENPAGLVRIAVCGFKPELDALAARKGGSAGEALLARLRASPVFSDGTVDLEVPRQNDRVTMIGLTLQLTRRLGDFDEAWIDRPPAAQDASEGGEDAGGEDL